jgi:hypothetical protein
MVSLSDGVVKLTISEVALSHPHISPSPSLSLLIETPVTSLLLAAPSNHISDEVGDNAADNVNDKTYSGDDGKSDITTTSHTTSATNNTTSCILEGIDLHGFEDSTITINVLVGMGVAMGVGMDVGRGELCVESFQRKTHFNNSRGERESRKRAR